MPELKPCPFCGGEADEYEGDYGNGIYCMMCGAMVGELIHLEYRTTKRVSIDEAIDAWNRRVKPGDDKSLTDEEMEILNDMPALKRLAMIAGFEVER